MLNFILPQKIAEAFTILCKIDSFRRGAEYLHSVRLQGFCDLQRRLSAKTDDDPFRLFQLTDIQHIFNSERFKIQFVGRIVIC